MSDLLRESINDARILKEMNHNILSREIFERLQNETSSTDDVSGADLKNFVKKNTRREIGSWLKKNVLMDEDEDIDLDFDEEESETMEYIERLNLEMDDDEPDEEDLDNLIQELEYELEEELGDDYNYEEDELDEEDEDSLFDDEPLSKKQHDKQMANFRRFNQYWMHHQPFSQMSAVAPLGAVGRPISDNPRLNENYEYEPIENHNVIIAKMNKIVPSDEEKKRLMEIAGVKNLDKISVRENNHQTETKRRAGILKTTSAKGLLKEWENEQKGKDILRG